MTTVLLILHLFVAIILIAVVLLQRSEGGALGIGGGPGSFMSGRSAANALSKATTFIAAAFFATSIGLTVLARAGSDGGSVLDRAGSAEDAAPADDLDGGIDALIRSGAGSGGGEEAGSSEPDADPDVSAPADPDAGGADASTSEEDEEAEGSAGDEDDGDGGAAPADPDGDG